MAVNKIYLQLAGGVVSQDGIFAELGFHVVLKNNWVATISHHAIEMEPKNMPADYETGSVLFIFYDQHPTENIDLYSITGGKFFKAGRKGWFSTEGGLSIVAAEKLSFTPVPVVSTWVNRTSNYSVEKEITKTIGAMLRADFNWAIFPFVGIGAGLFANFNAVQTSVGFQVKLMAGWMNYKRKH